jgi:hypothetical protein
MSAKKQCWKGYKMVGVKTKNGRTVPNCVPAKALKRFSELYSEYADTHYSEEHGFSEEVSDDFEQKEAGKKLNKPFRTPKGPKKFAVYVKNDKGNIVKVNFGDPNMSIKRDDPQARKNFRSRHNCSDPGPKWKARYWSCKFWSKKAVSKMV